MTYTDMDDLDLCQDYCTCGTPDPYNEGHTDNCAMSLPIEILREIELMVKSTTDNRQEGMEWIRRKMTLPENLL